MTSSWDSGDSDSVLDIFRLSEQALELVAQVVELPSLEVFKWPLEMALGDTVQWLIGNSGGAGLAGGLRKLGDLMQYR